MLFYIFNTQQGLTEFTQNRYFQFNVLENLSKLHLPNQCLVVVLFIVSSKYFKLQDIY